MTSRRTRLAAVQGTAFETRLDALIPQPDLATTPLELARWRQFEIALEGASVSDFESSARPELVEGRARFHGFDLAQPALRPTEGRGPRPGDPR